MQLTYRAANYESNLYAVNLFERDGITIYRGVKTKFNLSNVVRQPQFPRLLKYRGVSYITWR